MKISIIIPAYNIREYLHYCIDSVLCQNGQCNYEILIVDDGSTDGTSDECDKYVGNENVKVIHKTNGGLSSARNAGIDAATGDWLMFVDGDDCIESNTIEYLSAIIKNHGRHVDFIQYRYIEVPDYGDNISIDHDSCSTQIVTDKYEAFRRKLSLGGIGASACTKLISRHIFETIRFKEGIIHEDEQFTAHLIDNMRYGVLYTDAVLYRYLIREGSIIKSTFNKKKLDIIPVQNEQIAILEQNGYYDLAVKVRSRMFIYLCLLYQLSRRFRDEDSAQRIEYELHRLLEHPLSVGGKFQLIVQALKLHLPALQLYYFFKKSLCPR